MLDLSLNFQDSLDIIFRGKYDIYFENMMREKICQNSGEIERKQRSSGEIPPIRGSGAK
jgi:hypothetical protein